MITPLDILTESSLAIMVSIFGMIASLIAEYYKLKQREKQKQLEEKEDISTYINDLNKKMIEAKKIQRIIDEKIRVQLETANELSNKNTELKTEVERLYELKNLSEKQIESLGHVLNKEFDKFGRRSLKENIMLSSFFFFLGVFTSLLFQRLF